MVAIEQRIEQQDSRSSAHYPHIIATDSAAAARNDCRDRTSKIRSGSADTQQIVTSLIFALRRGGSRHETLCAVSNLMELCNAAAVGETALETGNTEGKAITVDPCSGKAIIKALLSALFARSLI